MALKMPDASSQFETEPNVVPMIDILLVLLIIFMMQVPLSRMTMDLQVPPPPDEAQQEEETPDEDQIVLELKADGAYEINKSAVPLAALNAEFHKIYDNRPTKILFVKTAANRLYREVVEVMDIARGAGVQVIGYAPPQPGESAEGQ